MKPAQIAGLVAAVVAAFMLATGLMTLSIFIRKRRERNEMMMYDEEKRPFLRYPASTARRNGPETATEGPLSFPSRGEPELRVTSRSEARQSTDSSASIPIEGIGVAISAEATNKHKRPSAYGPRHPLPADTRQQRRQTLCFTLEASGRPDSVLSQDTVFEEDDGRSRHRRSALLPAPPVPIPPIRTLRPARPIAHLPPIATQQEVPAIRSQAIQQASLSLAIPVRHSRSLAEVFPSPPEARPAVAMLAPAIHISATSTPQEAGAISAASSGYGTEGYIPDYYFRQHTPMPTLSAPHYAQRTPKEAPQLAAPKPKKSASTVSRTTSTSTHVRDSISSQTSFESIDSNDPTPEEDDGDKELSDAARLSPVAESPISSLRYPKIPRASNQRVPRSPQSPGSPTSQQGQAPFRRPAEPSALLVKRRGEREALKLENGLRMDSVQRPDGEGRNGNHQQVTRTASMQTRDPSASNDRTQPRGRRTRVQSGNELRSPAMYGLEAVRAVDSVRHGEVETVPKSPAWVPNLTPKRHGEDLFLDVSYTKPVT
ncbi:uncharacterized protein EI97DRAFT_376844 [Westerdykella ornata]|uniref:Uncharacterized protein n=1 Tax=Westerdykella ornata TaxID=318751 RepID=A0A6A6JJQ6_WESOR|nr:uncharacterized protein EI97DRAFT_376844 [Westerdykella ornata]KAF2276363.1 hypothetical protein EI97DRAFT_376844 [Westerdykella ornata]